MSTNPIKRLWHAWKALKLPWRKRYLVGSDLAGNTFWEFRLDRNVNRPRRIVQYASKTHHSDVRVTPQWHQWLRYTRAAAPSMQEQRMEEQRLVSIKRLAQLADERWRSKPSLLDGPEMRHPPLETVPNDPGGYALPTGEVGRRGVRSAVVGAGEKVEEQKEDPWREASRRGAPGENWQPDAWKPQGASAKRL